MLKNVVTAQNREMAAFDYTATLTMSNNLIVVYGATDGYPIGFSGGDTCAAQPQQNHPNCRLFGSLALFVAPDT
jgi:hypothetical protein